MWIWRCEHFKYLSLPLFIMQGMRAGEENWTALPSPPPLTLMLRVDLCDWYIKNKRKPKEQRGTLCIPSPINTPSGALQVTLVGHH